MAEALVTADAFERGYARRSRMTVAALRALGRVVRPCSCGEGGCEGWVSVSHDVAAELDYRAVGQWRVVVDGEVLMPFTKAQIAEIFTYHEGSPDDVPAYEAIRSKARELAETILAHTPMSPDQTTAIRKLREAVMTANAAIALQGKF